MDFQHFTGSGTWHKPPGTEHVDIILCGAPGWGVGGLRMNGKIAVVSFDADDLPDDIAVTGGPGGYAVIISRECDAPASCAVASGGVTDTRTGDAFGQIRGEVQDIRLSLAW